MINGTNGKFNLWLRTIALVVVLIFTWTSVVWADGHARVMPPTWRQGSFGYGFQAEDFRRNLLADIDRDGDLSTDELFDLE